MLVTYRPPKGVVLTWRVLQGHLHHVSFFVNDREQSAHRTWRSVHEREGEPKEDQSSTQIPPPLWRGGPAAPAAEGEEAGCDGRSSSGATSSQFTRRLYEESDHQHWLCLLSVADDVNEKFTVFNTNNTTLKILLPISWWNLFLTYLGLLQFKSTLLPIRMCLVCIKCVMVKSNNSTYQSEFAAVSITPVYILPVQAQKTIRPCDISLSAWWRLCWLLFTSSIDIMYSGISAALWIQVWVQVHP